MCFFFFFFLSTPFSGFDTIRPNSAPLGSIAHSYYELRQSRRIANTHFVHNLYERLLQLVGSSSILVSQLFWHVNFDESEYAISSLMIKFEQKFMRSFAWSRLASSL